MKTTIHHLSSNQVQSYHEQGFLILKQVFSEEEASRMQAEADRLVEESWVHPNNLRTKYGLAGKERCVERIDPVIDVSPLFKSLLTDSRIVNPLRDIFRDDPVLFKDKLIFKLPGMKGYSMHQDYAWWQAQQEGGLASIPAEKILSVTVAIDAATPENGALEVFSGYQNTLLSTPGELRNLNEAEAGKIDRSTMTPFFSQPGDVIIFHSLTPHRSDPNHSPYSRRQLYMTYNAAEFGDVYQDQQKHYLRYSVRNTSKTEKEKQYFK